MWRTLGWEPQWMGPLSADGFSSATRAQLARIYAAHHVLFKDDDYLMTSDADMLPLSDYWHPHKNAITCWGRDLTDYHYPICYIGATKSQWVRLMKDDLYKDLHSTAITRTTTWCMDQDIVTHKLLQWGVENIHHVARGTDKRTGYPIGRVDRSNWRLDHVQLIDAHLPHDIATNRQSFINVQELYSILKVKYKLAPKLTDLLC